MANVGKSRVDEAGDRKLFTVDEANAALPLVGAIVADVVAVSREIVERRERLSLLGGAHKSKADDPYAQELAQIEEELEKERLRLYEYAAELQALGVELKDGVSGLVDFPSRLDDRIVYLCWKYGEPEVLHWHELDAGFAGRRPLTACSEAAASSGASSPGLDDVERHDG